MKIKIGTLHLKEGEFTEYHTEYPGDWREYKQEAQDVPLFISFEDHWGPRAMYAHAQWAIWVSTSKTTKSKDGVETTNMRHSYSDKKRLEMLNWGPSQYAEWTPDTDFPEPFLLVSKKSHKWDKKYVPTWQDLYSLSGRHEEDFKTRTRYLAQADTLWAQIRKNGPNRDKLWKEYAHLLRQVYPVPDPQHPIQVEVIDWSLHSRAIVLTTSCGDVYDFKRMEYELGPCLGSEQVKTCGYCDEYYISDSGVTDDHDYDDEDYYINEKFDFCSFICLGDYQMKLEKRMPSW